MYLQNDKMRSLQTTYSLPATTHLVQSKMSQNETRCLVTLKIYNLRIGDTGEIGLLRLAWLLTKDSNIFHSLDKS